MAQFKYLGGADAVEIPGVGVVARGGVIEVAPPLSTGLMGQDVWEHVTHEQPEVKALDAQTKAELEATARDRGVDLTGLTTKADYIAAIEAADTTEES